MTENELLAELKAELNLEPLKPQEVTSRMLAEATGLSLRAAACRLDKGVQNGELKWRWVRDGVSRLKAYSKL